MERREKDIFLNALERPPVERAAFLDGACGEDAPLRARIEALLDRHDEESAFLASPTAGGDTLGGAAEGPGDRIGPYKLLQEIGEGGFGVVYLAEQEAPVRRKVALKIIKFGMDTDSVIARFEAERQALALMNHPNVAKVLDGGATESGRPYFVMELVRGVSITEYCAKNSLPVDARLRLFVAVCNAVQHAHQKGVIHRDLKPSNVMVTLHDGEPVPKVIDFGIAKAVDRSTAVEAQFTEAGQLVGTPSYMSPEQAELDSDDVDTRSDVYSLGVMLYELLTGAPPLDKSRARRASYEAIRRMIREEEPARPSERVAALPEKARVRALGRDVSADEAADLLRGDVDWIVIKALEKERALRYQSASEFAQDVARHLAHEPVHARPPSTRYRVTKLMRKHRRSVATGAIAFVTFVVAASGTALALVSANRARTELNTTLQEATRERNRAIAAEKLARENTARALEATREAERNRERAAKSMAVANATNRFVNEDLLGAAQPSDQFGRGRDALMRDALEAASARIESAAGPNGSLSDQPELEAAIRRTISIVFSRLGSFEKAERHARRAATLAARTLGNDRPEVLAYQESLGSCLRAMGRHDEAEPILLSAALASRRMNGADHPATASLQREVALVYAATGRFERAATLLDEARASLEKGPGDPDVRYRVLAAAAVVSLRRGRLAPAERLLREVVRLTSERLGPEHVETLRRRSDLASVLITRGKFDDAERYQRGLLATCRSVFGPEHDSTLVAMYTGALLDWKRGRNARAREGFERCEEIRRRVLGATHIDTVKTGWQIARILRGEEHHEAAGPILDDVVARARRGPGVAHPLTHLLLRQQVENRLKRGLVTEAIPIAQELYDLVLRANGPDHRGTIGARWDIAMARFRAGRTERALRDLLDVVERSRRAYGRTSELCRDAMRGIREAYRALERDPVRHPVEAAIVTMRLQAIERATTDAERARLQADAALTLMTTPDATLRDDARALRLASDAHAASGGDPRVAMVHAVARWRAGEPDRARALRAAALRSIKADDGRRAVLERMARRFGVSDE